MKKVLLLLAVLAATASVSSCVSAGKTAPKPLYADPVHDGAADPEIIRNRQTGQWFMFYTMRRADMDCPDGVSWAHGTPIGIAVSSDLARWEYLQNAEIGYSPDAEPTYWAPSLVDDGTTYHMFLTYVPGTFADWDHPRYIVHLTSDDLLRWQYRQRLELMSDRVIDADVTALPDGGWRMWYNQEPGGKLIAYADSPDLFSWQDRGPVPGAGCCEAPKVFQWNGRWWMICDEWKGLAVYRSDDALNWTRQEGNILQTPGTGRDDGVIGHHCEVLVLDDRAFIFYFTHPDREEDAAWGGSEGSWGGLEGSCGAPDVTCGAPDGGQRKRPCKCDGKRQSNHRRQQQPNPRRSVIQVAELLCPDGLTLSCDRDTPVIFP